MIIGVRRQRSGKDEPFYQEFEYVGDLNVTVAFALDYLNYNDDLYDIHGKKSSRIRWECSCNQKVCGACGMLINQVPSLACGTFLKDLKEGKAVLEPLTKFPLIADLIVDKSILFDNLMKMNLWVDKFHLEKEQKPTDFSHQYNSAKCLKCGLCLEICPNYYTGMNYYGPAVTNEAYLAVSQNEKNSHRKTMRKEYQKHFSSGCSKSLACAEICPVHMETLSSIGKLNRSI